MYFRVRTMEMPSERELGQAICRIECKNPAELVQADVEVPFCYL